jgi:hypothetical protein
VYLLSTGRLLAVLSSGRRRVPFLAAGRDRHALSVGWLARLLRGDTVDLSGIARRAHSDSIRAVPR